MPSLHPIDPAFWLTTVPYIPNKRDPFSPVRAGLWEVGAALSGLPTRQGPSSG